MANTSKKPAAKRQRTQDGSRKGVKGRKEAIAQLAENAGGGLTSVALAFCTEYLKDHNGTRAYMRVRPACAVSTAATAASRLLGNPKVQAEIARMAHKIASEAGISARNTLMDAWRVLTADVREVSELHVTCCRHCWGKAFRFQYTDAELEDAHADFRLAHSKATKAARAALGQFDPKGGGGFDKRRVPNPECPTCAGIGNAHPVFHDTRTYGPGAVAAFMGVEETKDGLKVRTRSKDHASDQLFRHFSLYRDKIELTMPTVRIRDFTGRKVQPGAAGGGGSGQAPPGGAPPGGKPPTPGGAS